MEVLVATKNYSLRLIKNQSARHLYIQTQAIKKFCADSQAWNIQAYLSNIPSCEPWLQGNDAARQSVERGLEQAKNGKGEYLGSFAEFAGLEIED
jgi:hypothetical protein